MICHTKDCDCYNTNMPANCERSKNPNKSFCLKFTSPPQPAQAEEPSLGELDTKHPDLLKWEQDHKCQLYIGSKITIKPTAEYYDEEYDKGKVYMVTLMYVDSGGLNLGINDGENDDRYSCETDGYYIADVSPYSADNKE